MNHVETFSGPSSVPVSAVSAASAMPAGLVAAPGVYAFNGQNYNCTTEGLYRFWDTTGNTFRNLIVYQSNVDAFMSAIAWLTTNGSADEALSISAKTNKALLHNIHALCGSTVVWALALCGSGNVNIQARTARAVTGNPALSNYFDSHVMLEAKVGGLWKLYDLSHNQTYTSAEGGSRMADVLPLIPSTVSTDIADDPAYASEAIANGTFSPTNYITMTMRTPAERRVQLERVLQIPGIDHSDGLTYFYLPAGMEGRESWLLSLSASWRVISKSAWLAMFYS